MDNNPENDLSIVSSSTGMGEIKEIKRLTTWAVVAFAMLSFGIYTFYWLYSRTKTVNNNLPEEDRIASWIPIVGIISFALYFILSIVPPLFLISTNPELVSILMGVGGIIGLVYIVIFLVWIFKLRSCLNLLSGSTLNEKFWLGGILTFFLNVMYFQWKINQIHDYG